MSTETQERTYGGGRQPPPPRGGPLRLIPTLGGFIGLASPGVGPLRLIPTVGLFIGLAATVLVSMRWGLLPALVFVLIALAASGPAVLRRRGRSLYSHWVRQHKWRAHLRKGRNHYRSGLA